MDRRRGEADVPHQPLQRLLDGAAAHQRVTENAVAGEIEAAAELDAEFCVAGELQRAVAQLREVGQTRTAPRAAGVLEQRLRRDAVAANHFEQRLEIRVLIVERRARLA